MLIMAFDSEESGEAARKQAWINYVKAEFARGVPIRNGGVLIDTLEGLTDDQIANLKVCGKLSGKTELTEGLTTSYTALYKAYEIEKWYFPEIPEQYRTGITGYEIIERPGSWVQPIPIQ